MPRFQERTQKIVDRMQAEEIDVMLVHNLHNIRYLSGFSGSHAVLVIEPTRWTIVTDGRYTEQVGGEVADYHAEIQGKRNLLKTVQDVLGETSSKRVGIEAGHLRLAAFEELNGAITVKEWVKTQKLVESLRMVKDEEEINTLRRALAVAESALQAVLPKIREGMTERELAHFIEDEMWNLGAKKESFETIALFGARSSLPHGQPSDIKLEKGDTILIDFGCVLDGYCSDITRMVFMGEPSEEIKEMFGCVQLAQKSALENLKAGLNCKAADEAARNIIRSAGREEQFMHGLGHGVGIEIHEAPRLSYLSDETLETGHVVTVEPGVYAKDVGGIRLENMAVITPGGCEVLNDSSTDMLVL